MLVAVTGGQGFIGSKLVEALLARGDEVRLLSRRDHYLPNTGVEWVVGDLADPDVDLSAFVDGIDVLYHCAGEINNAALMRMLHVDGTRRLLEAANGRVKRWVQLSSVGAYGLVRSGKVTEDCNEAPVGEYEITKTEADALVQAAAGKGYFETVIVRPSIVYGPTMTNQSLHQLIGAVARGWFAFIGKPGASANYVHVDNVVRALLLCAGQPKAKGRCYIVSDYATIEDLIDWMARALGRPTPKLRLPMSAARMAVGIGRWIPDMPLTEGRINALSNFAWYSDQRIRDELDYRPAVSLQQGIEAMVAIRSQRFGGTKR